MAAAHVPIRHIDNIEVPASGMWPAAGASSVVTSTWRHGARATPVVGGWLEIGDDPATNSLCIELADSILLATTASVSHNDNGWPEWHLEGFACATERRDPLALTLRCHGVFQRGLDTWAWWSGEGTIGAPARRRGRRRRRPLVAGGGRVVVELLFAPPGRTGVELSNVVEYMLHRMNAAAIDREAPRAVDPTFGMLHRILGAAQADLNVSSQPLPARAPARLIEARGA
jgi:hypothetical protein